MKLKIDRKALITALGRVDVIPNRVVLPILANVLLTAKEGKLSLFSTNLEVGIKEVCVAEVEEEGEITVPLKKLVDLLKVTKASEVSLKTKESFTLVVKGDSSSSIKGIEAKEFPLFPMYDEELISEIDSGTLKDALAKGSIAAASDESKVLLNAVYFDFTSTILKIVSTDSFKMSIKTLNIPSSKNISAVIPLKSIEKINSLSGNIKIYFSKGAIFFITETIMLFMQLIDSEYMKYEQLLPTICNTKISFSKEDFISFGKQACLFANNNAVTVNILEDETGNKLEMKSVGDEGENQGSFLINKLLGNNQSFLLHMKNALNGISIADSKEILLEYDKPNTPILFRDGDDFIYIMAVMVNT